MIEGVCGAGAKGDIAVDDISMISKNCSEIKSGNYYKFLKFNSSASVLLHREAVLSGWCNYVEYLAIITSLRGNILLHNCITVLYFMYNLCGIYSIISWLLGFPLPLQGESITNTSTMMSCQVH